jgi:hypothetical protein
MTATGRTIETDEKVEVVDPIDGGDMVELPAIGGTGGVKSVSEGEEEGVREPLGTLTNIPCLASDMIGAWLREPYWLEILDRLPLTLNALRMRDMRLLSRDCDAMEDNVGEGGITIAAACPFSNTRPALFSSIRGAGVPPCSNAASDV